MVLGAVRRPGRFGFTTRAMSLLDALGETGGLADEQADPRGVFVFRRMAAAAATPVTSKVAPERPAEPAQGTIYHLDMSRPEAMFVAGRFGLRDDDLIYVSNAPFTELRKVLSVILPTVGFVGSVNSLVAP